MDSRKIFKIEPFQDSQLGHRMRWSKGTLESASELVHILLIYQTSGNQLELFKLK